MTDRKIWTNILAGVKSQISASMYKAWFPGSYLLDIKKTEDREILVVGVGSQFLRAEIEKRYLSLILKIAKKNGFLGDILFVVSRREQVKKSQDNRPLFSGVAQTYLGFSKKNDNLNPYNTFESFVVGSSNNLASLAFRQASETPGRLYNPLFVYGPTGVGKTHLMQAVGNEILNKMIDVKVLYVSAEKFTNDFIESINNRATPAFRQKYRGVDVFLVDDVQFFAGKESTQDEFFFTYNELFMAGKQIVLASDRHPREMGRIQDRLMSRFLGGMAVDIQKPDVELRSAILKSKCREKDIVLEDDVISYIASVCETGARELEGVLVQVLTLTKLSSGQITLEQIKRAIGTNIRENKPKPTPGKIIDVVSRHFKVANSDLCGQTRKASAVFARQVLMYLLRIDLGLPLGGVGELAGGRDHSTVLYGVDKVTRRVLADQNLRDEISRIRSTF